MSIPITPGTGAASVAAEAVSGLQYQRIEVVGQGGSSILTVDANGAITTNTVIIGGSVTAVSQAAANQSVSGTVQTDVRGSVATVLIGGSIAASFTPPANQSVSGTVQTDVRSSVAVAIISGSIAATFTPPANQSVSGTVDTRVIASVATVIIGGSIAASVTPAANQSVSGTVGASIIGLPPIMIRGGGINMDVQQEGTAKATVTGIGILFKSSDSSSIMSVPSPSTPMPTLDTISSIATLNGALAVDAPMTKWVQGTADLRVVQGASVTVLAAQGASVHTYIKSVQVANMGSASVLVTLGGGLGSILGYTIAPAGGGSNIVYPSGLKTGHNSAFTASISGTASVLVSAQGFTSAN